MAALTRAIAAFHAGDLDRAAALCMADGSPDAMHLLGLIAHQRGERFRAEALVRQALAAQPDNARWQANLGAILIAREAWMPALLVLRKAVHADTSMADAHNNLALALLEAGYPEPALREANAAIALKPRYAAAHNNRGAALQDLQKLDEARRAFDRAVTLNPKSDRARLNRGLNALLRGDFSQGWDDYEARIVPRRPRAWDGRPLNGDSICLYAEQGLGDALHFARFAAVLAEQGEVILEVPRRLHPILKQLPGDFRLIGTDQIVPTRWTCPLMSLPRLVAPTPERFTPQMPYLSADPDRIVRWWVELPEAPVKIGVCWQGNPTARGDGTRSFSLQHLRSLAAIPGVALISLQRGAGEPQLDGVDWVHALDGLDEDAAFVDTAAVMMSLDLVVTADTSVAHLAGALGRPVWIALRAVPDWRWMLDREDSPWYPTARLFRQPTPGDWDAVFQRMKDVLIEEIAARPLEK
ncbi:MAG: tetratricopeptide repeat protein [Myxococcota bacterium]